MRITLCVLAGTALVPGAADVREVPTTLELHQPAAAVRTTWSLDWQLESSEVTLPTLGIESFDTPLATAGAFTWSAVTQAQLDDEGALRALVRNYDEAEREVRVEMPKGTGFPGTTLEDAGATLPCDLPVRFVPAAEGRGASATDFVAEFVQVAGGLSPTGEQADVLDALTARLDGATWLELGAREVGDTWDVPGEALAELWFPTGDPAAWWWQERGRALADLEWDAAGGALGDATFGARVLGDATATYRGLGDVDGVECARIELAFDDHVEVVLPAVASLLARLTEALPVPFEAQPLVVDAALDGEGVLFWDVEAGRLHRLDFEADAELDVRFGTWIAIADSGPGRYIEYDATLVRPVSFRLVEAAE